MRYLLLLFLTGLLGCSLHPPASRSQRSIASDSSWGFLVLSDIHVYTAVRNGRKIVPKDFDLLARQLVSYVQENNIKFVILLGDSTGGNKNDGKSLAAVKMWWDELRKALLPVMEQGVQVLPVAGNHDFYTPNHQEGYRYAWRSFIEAKSSEVAIEARNPLYYVASYGELELFLLHAVDYHLGSEQEAWLKEMLDQRRWNDKLKIAFGHVALYTRLIKRPYAKFGDRIRKMLLEGGVTHYVAGHEHYFWDEIIGEDYFRQTIMGTSSGTYTFAPNLQHYQKYCRGKVCQFEPDGLRVAVNPKDRKQVKKQMFLHFKVSGSSYQMLPMAFERGEITTFHLP